MNTYTLSRFEHYRDNKGTVTSIFLAVNVSDGVNSTTQEHWCSTEEKDLILADEANLTPILEKLFAEGELKMENEVATKPMPPIFPLQEATLEGQPTKKEALEALVKPAKIAIEKTKLKNKKLAEAALITP